MSSTFLILRLILLFLSVFLLSNCVKELDDQKQSIASSGNPYTLTVDAYLARAKNQLGAEKQNLLILAAGRAIYENRTQLAAAILSQTEELSAVLMKEKTILLAKIDFINGQPKMAIEKLASIHELNGLSVFYQTHYHESLALSYEALGHNTLSVIERIKLERLITDQYSRKKNRQRLMTTLNKLPMADIETLALEAKPGSDLQGWMKLIELMRKKTTNNSAFIQQIEQWQQQFPVHPANDFLHGVENKQVNLSSSPKQMALLLPLSGPLSGPGGAVRDGFMAAYNSSKLNHDVTVKLYDTAANQADLLYQQALAEGAEYIVGPLIKADVAKVAILNHPVPTLLLNDPDKINPNSYWFSLSPQEEARQVAAKAYEKGLKRALIIAPIGSWGNEVITAFNQEWIDHGGTVVDTLVYDEKTDLNKNLRLLLNVSEHEARQKQFKPGFGQEISNTPKRREDFDMIFLLAYPSKARQIMPLLKYYFVADIPVFSTSSVYAGSINSRSDKDLDGIIFCDMPWVFTNQLGNKTWPEQWNSYSRLYALGMDSYVLANQLNQLVLFPDIGINSSSGLLRLNTKQQVTRDLAWGRFKKGIAIKSIV